MHRKTYTLFRYRHIINFYGSDSEITNLVDRNRLFIIPSINPDVIEATDSIEYDYNRIDSRTKDGRAIDSDFKSHDEFLDDGRSNYELEEYQLLMYLN